MMSYSANSLLMSIQFSFLITAKNVVAAVSKNGLTGVNGLVA